MNTQAAVSALNAQGFVIRNAGWRYEVTRDGNFTVLGAGLTVDAALRAAARLPVIYSLINTYL